MRDANNTSLNLSRGWITGVQTAAVDYQAEINATTLVIQLRPGGLARLCGHEADTFTDWMCGLELLPTSPFQVLKDRLMGLTSGKAVIAAAKTFLLQYVVDEQSDSRLIDCTVKEQAHGDQSIARISDRVGYSHKHLIYRFKQTLAATPKVYQRIFRFDSVLMLMHDTKVVSMAELTTVSSYADQPHFVREFKEFTGYSPSQYLSQRRLYAHVNSL